MIFLRSLLFNTVFYLSSVVIGVGAVPVLLGSPSFMRRAGASWSHLVIRMLKTIAGTGWQVRGKDRVPDGPVIFAIKHQSAWDTFFFPAYLDEPAMVAKKELRLIPFYGWYAWRAEAVWIDRSKGSRAIRTLIRGAEAAIKQGRSIVMFPQGTRTAPGEIRPYQAGIAALYRATKVPVVPVAINSGMYWGKRTFLKYPGSIIVEFLEPMPKGLDRGQFLEELATRVDSATSRLEAEVVR